MVLTISYIGIYATKSLTPLFTSIWSLDCSGLFADLRDFIDWSTVDSNCGRPSILLSAVGGESSRLRRASFLLYAGADPDPTSPPTAPCSLGETHRSSHRFSFALLTRTPLCAQPRPCQHRHVGG